MNLPSLTLVLTGTVSGASKEGSRTMHKRRLRITLAFFCITVHYVFRFPRLYFLAAVRSLSAPLLTMPFKSALSGN